MTRNNNFKTTWFPFLAFVVLSLLLYHRSIGRSFVSDDFLVLRRVAIDKKILINGFFRPLSDLTIYANYLIGGFNPVGYYLFGILVHALNSFLLLKFCQRWKWTEDKSLQSKYALFASILFLCYPFHNESIVWLLGRGSSMASSFGILGLLVAVSNIKEKKKIFLVCVCFFSGLTAYESILLLPLMVLIVIFKRGIKFTRYLPWVVALTTTFLLHIIIRFKISGVVVGSYGENFFSLNPFHYFSNLCRVAGRFFLPPIENTYVFVTVTFLLVVGVILLIVINWHRFLNPLYLLKIIGLIIISSAIPILASISTKTSESDRFLYFPSFFICCFISIVVVDLIHDYKKLLLAGLLISSYFIFFLEKNNSNWITASDISKDILQMIKDNNQYKKIFIVNLPEEYNGAYIYRLGFKDALAINGLDTSKTEIVNTLNRGQMFSFPSGIHPSDHRGETFIPPSVMILSRKGENGIFRGNDTLIHLNPGTEALVIYWNNREFKKLP